MSTNIYGIDGCKSGWVIAHYVNNQPNLTIVKSLADFSFHNNARIIIDMPVLCPESVKNYPRKRDILAKKKLGGYHSRVFYAPVKSWLHKDYAMINDICEQHSKPKLSKQSFNLFKTILDVQSFIDSNPHYHIEESHPELVFQYLNNGMPLESKKSSSGQSKRIDLLKELLPDLACINTPLKGCSIDDILDAIAMIWVGKNNNPY
ncbi:MAG: DUF429 domain-containing protein [Candidatus Margulisiibacteriota bacterium]|nr:DUF429 domain-containing protein [Candidatus Margulisiibacteriota bacterium]